MNTKATTEQREKALARRQQMRALAKQISAMPLDKRMELAKQMPVVNIEGRTLSLFNNCFIVTQNPSATVVGGFQQWRKAGRMVRKGEHGMALWFPTNQANGDSETLNEETDKPEIRFLLGTVFDVSQTEEKESEGIA